MMLDIDLITRNAHAVEHLTKRMAWIETTLNLPEQKTPTNGDATASVPMGEGSKATSERMVQLAADGYHLSFCPDQGEKIGDEGTGKGDGFIPVPSDGNFICNTTSQTEKYKVVICNDDDFSRDITIDGTTVVTIQSGACPLVSLEVPAGKKAKFGSNKGRYKPV